MASRILLITPKFYGIENIIKEELEESGYEVVWFENKILTLDYHGANSKLKFLRRIYFFLFTPHIWYVKKELGKIENTKFDILFSINAHIMCKFLFKKLNCKNPGLQSVLYLWDSFAMYSWEKEIKRFKKVFTFDLVDSEKYKIEYKPLFFVKAIGTNNQNCKYDLFFAGRFNPLRLFLIDKILNQLEGSGINYFVKLWPSYKIYFHNHLVYKLFKMFNSKCDWIKDYQLNYEAIEGRLKKHYILEDRISYEEVQKQMQSSNVILNLPFQRQTGYSYGLIEALANGKKIITTNSKIIRESFFNCDQIQILNEYDPVVDYDWIRKKSSFPVPDYFLDLELSAWLKSILNDGVAKN